MHEMKRKKEQNGGEGGYRMRKIKNNSFLYFHAKVCKLKFN